MSRQDVNPKGREAAEMWWVEVSAGPSLQEEDGLM